MDLSFELIALLMAVAFAAGFIDAIAGGGGLLSLSALLAAGVPPVAALATNKLQGTLGTGGAALAFARKGHVDIRRIAWPIGGALAGAAAGAATVQRVDPSFLAGLIPVLLVAMALYFLLGPKVSEEDRHGRIGRWGLGLLTAGIGFYDGFFGPGTGAFLTTALVALAGLGLVRAIAHAKVLNFTTNLASLAVFIAGGQVLWTLGLAMAAANIAGGQVGAHTAMRFGGRIVRPLLVMVCLALTAKLLLEPDNPLRTLILGAA